MRCNRIQKYILLQKSGELGPARRRMLEAHLEACEHCRQFARDLGRLIELVQTNLPVPQPPPVQRPPVTVTVPAWWTPLRLAAVAASLLLVAALAIGYGRLRQRARRSYLAELPVRADAVAAEIAHLYGELEQLARDIASEAIFDPYNAMTLDEISQQLLTMEDT